MNPIRILIAALLLPCGMPDLRANTASIKIENFSFVLEPMAYSQPGYSCTTLFTTYDGSSGEPLRDGDTVSCEVKPDAPGSSTYRTDYLTVDAWGLESYGTMVLNIPNTDSDADGLPDFLQKNRAVSLSFTGTQYCQYARDNDGENASFSGTMTRSAGSATGTVVIDGSGSVPQMTSPFHLVGGDGTLSYDRQSGSSTFVIQMWPVGNWGDELTGSASLSQNGPNEVTMVNLQGDLLSFEADVVLERHGNTYRSRGQISDGFDETSWADYRDCLIEIVDLNDSDGDGIPNLTDDVAAVPLEEGLDAPSAVWTTGGDALWTSCADVSHDGLDAARSGAVGASQTSWLETTVTGPLPISFWWKVSSENNYDWLRFAIDGAEQARISGEVDWQQRHFDIPAGPHTLRWSYTKDGSLNRGSDAGWLDQVSLVASPSFHWATAEITAREDAGQVTLNVRRIGSSAGTARVDFFTTNGTARAGSDYTAAAGTLTFGDGETNRAVVVALLNDLQSEADEIFTIRLCNPSSGYVLAEPNVATVRLTDDDEPPPGQGPILFTSDRDGDFEIFVMNEDGSGVRQLTFNTSKDSKARWAPDGRAIYFIRDDAQVWRMDRDGGNQQQITDGQSLAVSPDGTQLAIAKFVSFWAARNLFIHDLATGQERLLVDHVGEDFHADFSPDGSRLVYVNYFIYYGDYYKNLHVVNVDGSGDTALTDYDEFTPGWPDSPRWSTDGNRILFSNHGEGQDDRLQTIAPDGSNHAGYISSSIGGLVSPVWSPDGHWVLTSLNGRVIKVDFPYTGGSYLTPTNSAAYATDWLRASAPAEAVLGQVSCDSNGIIRFSLQGPAGSMCVLQTSTNLIHWTPLSTNSIPPEGVLTVTDPTSSTRPARFYRAVAP